MPDDCHAVRQLLYPNCSHLLSIYHSIAPIEPAISSRYCVNSWTPVGSTKQRISTTLWNHSIWLKSLLRNFGSCAMIAQTTALLGGETENAAKHPPLPGSLFGFRTEDDPLLSSSPSSGS